MFAYEGLIKVFCPHCTMCMVPECLYNKGNYTKLVSTNLYQLYHEN